MSKNDIPEPGTEITYYSGSIYEYVGRLGHGETGKGRHVVRLVRAFDADSERVGELFTVSDYGLKTHYRGPEPVKGERWSTTGQASSLVVHVKVVSDGYVVYTLRGGILCVRRMSDFMGIFTRHTEDAEDDK